MFGKPSGAPSSSSAPSTPFMKLTASAPKVSTSIKPTDLHTFEQFYSGVITGLDELIEGWVESCARSYTFVAGIPPARARKIFNQLAVEQLVRFFYVVQVRGMKIDKIASKAGLAADIVKWGKTNLKIKSRVAGGSSEENSRSLMSHMVVFSDINMLIRNKVGTQTLGEETYSGPLEVKYQWNGSLPCFYHPNEEAMSTEEEWTRYYLYVFCVHENFSDWYVAVRREAAINQGRVRSTEDNKKAFDRYKARIVESRKYYELQLSTYNLATRKTWYNGGLHSSEQGKLAEVQIAACKKAVSVLDAFTGTLVSMPGKGFDTYKGVLTSAGFSA